MYMKFQVEGTAGIEWIPQTMYRMKHDHTNNFDATVVFVKFGHEVNMQPNRDGGTGVSKTNQIKRNAENDVVVIRLLNEYRSRNKMLSIRITRKSGKISIHESTITSSFFFSNERDAEMESVTRNDLMSQMEEEYVGFWIMYRKRSVSYLMCPPFAILPISYD